MSYQSRLKCLQLEQLQLRRLKCDLIACYKILHGYIDTDFAAFFSLYSWKSHKGHNRYKLAVQQSTVNAFKYGFSNRFIHVWNELPTAVVEAENISVFRRLLDKTDFTKYCIDFECSI